jgi:DNA segregation ATPase FtsK/SpoIIIE, S-DNA-T family
MSSASRKKTKQVSGDVAIAGRQHEIIGIVFCLAAAIVLLSLASFSPADPVFEGIGQKAANLIGIVGAYLANGLLASLGMASFLLGLAFVYAAVIAFSQSRISLSFRKILGGLTLIVLGTVFGHVVFSGQSVMGHPPGGIVGEYSSGLMVSLLSTTGTIVLAAAGMILGLIEVTGFSPLNCIKAAWRGLKLAATSTAHAIAWAATRLGHYINVGSRWTFSKLLKESKEMLESLRDKKTASTSKAKTAKPTSSDSETVDPLSDFLSPPVTEPPVSARREPLVVTSDPGPPAEPAEEEKTAKRSFKNIKRDQEPEIVIPRATQKEPEPDEAVEKQVLTLDLKDYQLPDIEFLELEEQDQTEIEKEQLHMYARRLEEKLADYGVQGRVKKIMPGPVVTMYEYIPAPGIKVSKIAGLSNDLALALGAMSVRIIAPIPGRSVVGIEVSNKHRQTVFAKEIIGHHSFNRSRSKLTLALGKNIEGTPFVTDLNKMPHLLVAGATGTGKSVALNSMIASILYKATPEDVRFIMVDPKVLELSLYEGIPHLLLPVVIDPRKAQAALNWAVNEMDRRIQILHAAGVRSLDNYNRKVERMHAKLAEEAEQKNKPKTKKVIVIDKTETVDEEDSFIEDPALSQPPDEAEDGEPVLEKMPHIVIVIDELADLMMTCSREVETSIARIAQKARAAGIHLIVATQRPSVNVITGLIKANLPARISFRVASKTDSRTILDQNGAETLLGNGDMLFHPPTSSQIMRIHGALITEEEINKVVEHLKQQAQPVYDESILASAEEDEDGLVIEEEDHDELYDKAVAVVAEAGQASTSMVQRKLRIGYNRAARLIERMEREGIIGPADGSRPRELLIQNHAP